jgi:hypothetical protein
VAWADTTRKAENGAGGAASLNVTLNSTVAGTFIAAGASMWKSTGAPASCAVTDDVNGAYTSSFFIPIAAATLAASLSYLPSGAGGTLTITFNPEGGGSGDTNDLCGYVHEFSGGHATPASGTPATDEGTSGTTAATGAMTPADNDVLVFAAMAYLEDNTITENAGAEGFTLSNESDSGNPGGGQHGSLVFKIISGAPGTPSHSWTLGAAGGWAAGIAAFKPAAAGGGRTSKGLYRPGVPHGLAPGLMGSFR